MLLIFDGLVHLGFGNGLAPVLCHERRVQPKLECLIALGRCRRGETEADFVDDWDTWNAKS